MSRTGPLFAAKAAAARGVGALSRISGRGAGTTLPGRALLRMDDRALGRLAARLDGPVSLVSGTNGKTTTASLLGSILGSAGREAVRNRAGSNMTWGLVTALLSADGEEGLFEVDEAWLPEVCDEIDPDLILLCNLFRDQLDRHGELETIAENWATMISARLARGTARLRRRALEPTVVLNADDPLVADLGRDAEGVTRPGVLYYGVGDRTPAREDGDLSVSHDAKHCRRCGSPYRYEVTLLGHLGHYRCERCGYDRPQPEVEAVTVDLRGMEGSRLRVRTPAGPVTVDLPLPGLYNAYNAIAALAAAVALGIDANFAAEALSRAETVFGRVQRVEIEGREVAILLIKNPIGASEVLRTIDVPGEAPVDLWIALNDGIADGRDISWIWDADFERSAASVRSVTCAGNRAEELALRLKYAGLPEAAIEVLPAIPASLDRALERADGRLFALPTYTALLELQSLLVDRGTVKGYLR